MRHACSLTGALVRHREASRGFYVTVILVRRTDFIGSNNNFIVIQVAYNSPI